MSTLGKPNTSASTSKSALSGNVFPANSKFVYSNGVLRKENSNNNKTSRQSSGNVSRQQENLNQFRQYQQSLATSSANRHQKKTTIAEYQNTENSISSLVDRTNLGQKPNSSSLATKHRFSKLQYNHDQGHILRYQHEQSLLAQAQLKPESSRRLTATTKFTVQNSHDYMRSSKESIC